LHATETTSPSFEERLRKDFEAIRDQMTELGMRNPISGALGNLSLYLSVATGSDGEGMLMGCHNQAIYLKTMLQSRGYGGRNVRLEEHTTLGVTVHFSVSVTDPVTGAVYDVDTWKGSLERGGFSRRQ
jgi:hypothetical protein